MLLTYQNKVKVPERELIHLSAMLDHRRTIAARMAKVAVMNCNYGAYIELRDSFEYADELLNMSMFDGYRDECTEKFPEYEDDGENYVDSPFLRDVAFSDGSIIDDTVDVPF